MKTIKFIKIFFILLFSISVSGFTLIFSKNLHNNDIFFVSRYFNLKQNQDELYKLQDIINKTTAQGVIVYDVENNEILGEKNIDKTYSLASITKIITGYLAYEKDHDKLNEIREMLKTSNNEEAENVTSVLSLNEQEKINYINEKVNKYNLYFRNASGLDIKTQDGQRIAGGEGKPQDVVNFIKDYYLEHPELFDQTIVDQNNTNLIVKDLDFITGSKTGYTDLSGGNLFVSVQKGLGRDIFILVLNSTEKNRFVDVQNIADFLLKSNI